jgi:hypothetical protein
VTVLLIQNPAKQGVIKNFEQAIRECDADYIALSDQDDVWSIERLETFEQHIRAQPREKPALFYSDLRIIDSAGEDTGKTFHGRLSHVPNRGEESRFLFTRNFIPGCSVILDARLRNLVLPIPADAIMHDWWINLVVSQSHDMVKLEQPQTQYRLHMDNTIGVSSLSGRARIVSENGFLATGFGNVAAVVRQLRAAVQRFDERDVPSPELARRFLMCFSRPPFFRIAWLVGLAIGRTPVVSTLSLLFFSSLVSKKYLDDRERPYR